MDKEQEILAWLENLRIQYELIRHPAAFTMQDMVEFGVTEKALIPKNLFLRNSNGKQHFLLTIAGAREVNLRAFGEQLGTRLSFASEQRLAEHLNLTPGAVTPLGVYYNTKEPHTVKVYLDSTLKKAPRVGVHPGVNTCTVVLSGGDLQKCMDASGVEWQFMDL